jgi:hypothetical protein
VGSEMCIRDRCELKRSYYDQAVLNLKAAEAGVLQPDLFGGEA